ITRPGRHGLVSQGRAVDRRSRAGSWNPRHRASIFTSSSAPVLTARTSTFHSSAVNFTKLEPSPDANLIVSYFDCGAGGTSGTQGYKLLHCWPSLWIGVALRVRALPIAGDLFRYNRKVWRCPW